MPDASMKKLLVKIGINSQDWKKIVAEIKQDLKQVEQQAKTHAKQQEELSKQDMAKQKEKQKLAAEEVQWIEKKIRAIQKTLDVQELDAQQTKKKISDAKNLISLQEATLNLLSKEKEFRDVDLSKLRERISLRKSELSVQEAQLRISAGATGVSIPPGAGEMGAARMAQLQTNLKRASASTAMTSIKLEMAAQEEAYRQGNIQTAAYVEKQGALQQKLHIQRMEAIAQEETAQKTLIDFQIKTGKMTADEAKIQTSIVAEQIKKQQALEEAAYRKEIERLKLAGVRPGQAKEARMAGIQRDVAAINRQTIEQNIRTEMQLAKQEYAQGEINQRQYVSKEKALLTELHEVRVKNITETLNLKKQEYQELSRTGKMEADEAIANINKVEAKLKQALSQEANTFRVQMGGLRTPSFLERLHQGLERGEGGRTNILSGILGGVAGIGMGGGILGTTGGILGGLLGPEGALAGSVLGMGAQRALDVIIEKFDALSEHIEEATGKETQLNREFKQLTIGQGADPEEFLTKLRTVSHGLADNAQLYQIANNFMRLGLKMTTDQIVDLTRVTIDLSRASGKTAEEGIQALVNASRTGYMRTLAFNTGISLTAMRLQGLSPTVTLAARQQMQLNKFLEEGHKQLQKMGVPLITLPELMREFSLLQTELLHEFSIGISSSASFQKALDQLSGIIAKAYNALAPLATLIGQKLGDAFAALVPAIDKTWSKIEPFFKGLTAYINSPEFADKLEEWLDKAGQAATTFFNTVITLGKDAGNAAVFFVGHLSQLKDILEAILAIEFAKFMFGVVGSVKEAAIAVGEFKDALLGLEAVEVATKTATEGLAAAEVAETVASEGAAGAEVGAATAVAASRAARAGAAVRGIAIGAAGSAGTIATIGGTAAFLLIADQVYQYLMNKYAPQFRDEQAKAQAEYYKARGRSTPASISEVGSSAVNPDFAYMMKQAKMLRVPPGYAGALQQETQARIRREKTEVDPEKNIVADRMIAKLQEQIDLERAKNKLQIFEQELDQEKSDLKQYYEEGLVKFSSYIAQQRLLNAEAHEAKLKEIEIERQTQAAEIRHTGEESSEDPAVTAKKIEQVNVKTQLQIQQENLKFQRENEQLDNQELQDKVQARRAYVAAILNLETQGVQERMKLIQDEFNENAISADDYISQRKVLIQEELQLKLQQYAEEEKAAEKNEKALADIRIKEVAAEQDAAKQVAELEQQADELRLKALTSNYEQRKKFLEGGIQLGATQAGVGIAGGEETQLAGMEKLKELTDQYMKDLLKQESEMIADQEVGTKQWFEVVTAIQQAQQEQIKLNQEIAKMKDYLTPIGNLFQQIAAQMGSLTSKEARNWKSTFEGVAKQLEQIGKLQQQQAAAGGMSLQRGLWESFKQLIHRGRGVPTSTAPMSPMDLFKQQVSTSVPIVNNFTAALNRSVTAINSFIASLGMQPTSTAAPGRVFGPPNVLNLPPGMPSNWAIEDNWQTGTSRDVLVDPTTGKSTPIKGPGLPTYQEGGTVPETGMALVHQGETIFPPGVLNQFIDAINRTIAALNTFVQKLQAPSGGSSTAQVGGPIFGGGTNVGGHEPVSLPAVSTTTSVLNAVLPTSAQASAGGVGVMTSMFSRVFGGLFGGGQSTGTAAPSVPTAGTGDFQDAVSSLPLKKSASLMNLFNQQLDQAAGNKNSGLQVFTQKLGNVVGALGGFANNVFGAKGTGSGILGGLLSGASTGMEFGGPIGAGIGAAVGGVMGGIVGSKQQAVTKNVEKLNYAFDQVIRSLNAGAIGIGDALKQTQDLRQQAVNELGGSKKGRKQLPAMLQAFDAEIYQLQTQIIKTVNDMKLSLAELAAGPAWSQITSQLASIMQKYEQFAQAAKNNTQEMAMALADLKLSLENYAETLNNDVRQANEQAIQDALDYNNLLMQRQNIINQEAQQEYEIMTQGVLTRQQNVAMTKMQQIANLRYNRDQQLDQINQELALTKYKLSVEGQIFNLATTRVGLEMQLLALKEQDYNNQIAVTIADQATIARIEQIVSSPRTLQLLGRTPPFGDMSALIGTFFGSTAFGTPGHMTTKMPATGFNPAIATGANFPTFPMNLVGGLLNTYMPGNVTGLSGLPGVAPTGNLAFNNTDLNRPSGILSNPVYVNPGPGWSRYFPGGGGGRIPGARLRYSTSSPIPSNQVGMGIFSPNFSSMVASGQVTQYDEGGTVPETDMALVHKGETIFPPHVMSKFVSVINTATTRMATFINSIGTELAPKFLPTNLHLGGDARVSTEQQIHSIATSRVAMETQLLQTRKEILNIEMGHLAMLQSLLNSSGRPDLENYMIDMYQKRGRYVAGGFYKEYL